MNVPELEAGKETDIYIAKLLGYFPLNIHDVWILVAPSIRQLTPEDYDSLYHVSTKCLTEERAWAYLGWEWSTSESDALALVEYTEGYSIFGLGFERDERGLGWWKATFLVKDDQHHVSHYTASAETAALAICRAWIRLKGSQHG
jgi:hypothetical protein